MHMQIHSANLSRELYFFYNILYDKILFGGGGVYGGHTDVKEN